MVDKQFYKRLKFSTFSFIISLNIFDNFIFGKCSDKKSDKKKEKKISKKKGCSAEKKLSGTDEKKRIFWKKEKRQR